MSQKKHMTKAQFDECKALFGPAPVLSTEDVAHCLESRMPTAPARSKWPLSELAACDTRRFA